MTSVNTIIFKNLACGLKHRSPIKEVLVINLIEYSFSCNDSRDCSCKRFDEKGERYCNYKDN